MIHASCRICRRDGKPCVFMSLEELDEHTRCYPLHSFLSPTPRDYFSIPI